MKLRTRLFLLFLLSGVLPLFILVVTGWSSLRQQRGLWNLPTVETALEASLRTNRRLFDRTLRDLENRGQREAATLPETWSNGEATAGELGQDEGDAIARRLGSLLEDGRLDLAALLLADGDAWRLHAQAGQVTDAGGLARAVPWPEASAIGPQRSRPLRWADPLGDLLVVPTYLWAEVRSEADSLRTEPAACLVLGARLGPGVFADLDETSEALVNYRRFGELGGLLARAQLLVFAVALLVALLVSGSLARSVARRISEPVEDLVAALLEFGRGSPDRAIPATRIPELARMGEAFAHMRDQLREYEELSRETERVRASQETARFVAHEIRNALTPVAAGIAVLERRVESLPEESRPQGRRALDAIRREADRMATLASTFSEYAHLPAPKPRWIDVRHAVRAVLPDVPPGVEVSTALPASEVRLFVDFDELERALRNLVKNACEAMRGEGKLRIEVQSDARWTEIVVRDDGPGMDPATREKSLQPGFTTKEAGTGLGLALVRGSVIRYGGRLEIESAPGEGTAVRIRLPNEAPAAEGVTR